MTEKKLNYAWDAKKKKVITFIDNGFTVPEDIMELLTVDTAFGINSVNRYGKWRHLTEAEEGLFVNPIWEHVAYENFPDEFKLALALVGIS